MARAGTAISSAAAAPPLLRRRSAASPLLLLLLLLVVVFSDRTVASRDADLGSARVVFQVSDPTPLIPASPFPFRILDSRFRCFNRIHGDWIVGKLGFLRFSGLCDRKWDYKLLICWAFEGFEVITNFLLYFLVKHVWRCPLDQL